jgi:hypothetical protein
MPARKRLDCAVADPDLHDIETLERGNAARSRTAQWSSLAALAVSALALALGAYQTRLMQTQARASVWPFVVLGYNFNDGGPQGGFELHVENNGVGPAILRSVLVRFDGKPVRHWKEVFAQIVPGGGTTMKGLLTGLHAVVIPPSTNRDTAVAAFRISDPDKAKLVLAAVDRLSVDICYCSIYDDCWVAHWLNAKLDSVAACHESDTEFDY